MQLTYQLIWKAEPSCSEHGFYCLHNQDLMPNRPDVQSETIDVTQYLVT